jgi:hypothetical protein
MQLCRFFSEGSSDAHDAVSLDFGRLWKTTKIPILASSFRSK